MKQKGDTSLIDLIYTFGYHAVLNPGFIFFTILIMVAYISFDKPMNRKVPLKQKLAFLFGMAIFYIAFGGPLYLYGHLFFSGHVLKLLALLFIAAPLLTYGISAGHQQLLFKLPGLKRLIQILTTPWIAFLTFQSIFILHHVPSIFDHLKMNYEIYVITQSLLFFFACMVWWSLFHRQNNLKLRCTFIPFHFVLFAFVGLTWICYPSAFYLSYSNLQSWSLMLEYCLPMEETIAIDELYQAFYSVTPAAEQKSGGIYLLLATLCLAFFFYFIPRKVKE